jgi:hypothetical protein
MRERAPGDRQLHSFAEIEIAISLDAFPDVDFLAGPFRSKTPLSTCCIALVA